MRTLWQSAGLAALTVNLTTGLAGSAAAGDLAVEIAVPRMSVAEYHRPYVAVWIARPDDQSVAANLAVWYQQDGRGDEDGKTWLKDMRQWWRRTGRTLSLPLDGVSGPTQAPGTHRVEGTAAVPGLDQLPPGEYVLHVEAAREVGGREMVSVPFSWPATAATVLSAQGDSELGTVTVTLSPGGQAQ